MNTQTRIPEAVYYPFTQSSLRAIRLSALFLMIVGALVWWVGDLPDAALVVSLTVPLLVVPVELLAWMHRDGRRATFLNGRVITGVVVEKKTLPIGPLHALKARYTVGRAKGDILL